LAAELLSLLFTARRATHVQIPLLESFEDASAHYATLGHEANTR
jgi:hypothetical protein